MLRPIGIALHHHRTREITLRRLRAIGSTRFGLWLIHFLGNMAPASALAIEKGPVRFPSPVVLSKSIDPQGRALPVFSQFGVGATEVDANAHVIEPSKHVIGQNRCMPPKGDK